MRHIFSILGDDLCWRLEISLVDAVIEGTSFDEKNTDRTNSRGDIAQIRCANNYGQGDISARTQKLI